MKRVLFFIFLALAAVTALHAGETATAVPSDAPYDYKGGQYITAFSAIKIIFVMALMAGMAYAAVKIMKKYNIGSINTAGGAVRVKSISTIIADKKIAVVEIRGNDYILAVTKDKVSLIDKIAGVPPVKGKRK
jgi:flagellar biogenesis protein FliO